MVPPKIEQKAHEKEITSQKLFVICPLKPNIGFTLSNEKCPFLILIGTVL